MHQTVVNSTCFHGISIIFSWVHELLKLPRMAEGELGGGFCCLFLGQLDHSVGTCPTQSSKYGSNEIHPYALVVVCSNGWTQCSNRVHWTSSCWPLISHHNYTWIILINQINEYFSPSFFTLTHTIPFFLISTYLL